MQEDFSAVETNEKPRLHIGDLVRARMAERIGADPDATEESIKAKIDSGVTKEEELRFVRPFSEMEWDEVSYYLNKILTEMSEDEQVAVAEDLISQGLTEWFLKSLMYMDKLGDENTQALVESILEQGSRKEAELIAKYGRASHMYADAGENIKFDFVNRLIEKGAGVEVVKKWNDLRGIDFGIKVEDRQIQLLEQIIDTISNSPTSDDQSKIYDAEKDLSSIAEHLLNISQLYTIENRGVRTKLMIKIAERGGARGVDRALCEERIPFDQELLHLLLKIANESDGEFFPKASIYLFADCNDPEKYGNHKYRQMNAEYNKGGN